MSGNKMNHNTNGPNPNIPEPNIPDKSGLAATSLIKKTEANNSNPTVKFERVLR